MSGLSNLNKGLVGYDPDLSGYVVGPASSTDKAIARFNGTTGKLIQNSGVIIDDSNNVSGINTELVGSNANFTDFPNAKLIASQADSGDAHVYNIGVAGEAVANNSNANIWGVGVYGKGSTNGATRSAGLLGDGGVSATGDTGSAIGVRGYATDTHAGGSNIGLYGDATGGSSNYALYMNRGDIFANAAQIWNLLDNNAASLSFDTTGKTGLLKFITTDGAEGISMSGNLAMNGAAITEAAFVTLASDVSGTTDIGAVASNNIFLTGSNTITSFGIAPAGTKRTIRVGGSGGSQIVYNQASMITANARDIVTAGNDVFEVVSLGSGNWIFLNYKTSNGRLLGNTFSNLIDAATISPNLALANNFNITLGGNRTLGVPLNPQSGLGVEGSIVVRQDSTGNRTLAYSWCYVFPQLLAPVLTTGKGAMDLLSFKVLSYSTSTATMTIATPCVVTWTNHGLVYGQRVAFSTTGALPTGITADTGYYVNVINSSTFNLATSLANLQAGTYVATSGSQSGVHTVTQLTILVSINANNGA